MFAWIRRVGIGACLLTCVTGCGPAALGLGLFEAFRNKVDPATVPAMEFRQVPGESFPSLALPVSADTTPTFAYSVRFLTAAGTRATVSGRLDDESEWRTVARLVPADEDRLFSFTIGDPTAGEPGPSPWPDPLADGPHRLQLRVRDANGSEDRIDHEWSIDSTAPESVPLDEVAPTGLRTARVRWRAVADTSVGSGVRSYVVRYETAAQDPLTSNAVCAHSGEISVPLAAADASGTFDLVIPDLNVGRLYRFWVVARDYAGNESLAPVAPAQVRTATGGDGTFASAQALATGVAESSNEKAVAVRAGDFNGDGIPDIAVANFQEASDARSASRSGTLTVMSGGGSGALGFTPVTVAADASQSPTGAVETFLASGLVVADMNRDGRDDLVALGQRGAPEGTSTSFLGEVAVFLQAEDQTTAMFEKLRPPAPKGPLVGTLFERIAGVSAAAAAEIRPDATDLIIGIESRFNDVPRYGEFMTLRGLAGDPWAMDGSDKAGWLHRWPDCSRKSVDAFTGATAVATGDFFLDDGLPDLVLADQRTIWLLKNLGPCEDSDHEVFSNFDAPRFLDPDGEPVALATGDFQGDGRIDLAVALASGQVAIYNGTAEGEAEPFLRGPTLEVGNGRGAIVVRDFNGDGLSDFVLTDSVQNRVHVVLASTSGGFAAPRSYEAGGAPSSIDAADFDGDGFLDIVVNDESRVGTVRILRGSGARRRASGGFAFAGRIPHPIGVRGLSAADLDGDGNIDLASATMTGSTNTDGTGATPFDLVGCAGGFAAAHTANIHFGPIIGADGRVRLGPSGEFPNRALISVPFRCPNSTLIFDIDNDGVLDIVIGTFLGIVRLYGIEIDGKPSGQYTIASGPGGGYQDANRNGGVALATLGGEEGRFDLVQTIWTDGGSGTSHPEPAFAGVQPYRAVSSRGFEARNVLGMLMDPIDVTLQRRKRAPIVSAYFDAGETLDLAVTDTDGRRITVLLNPTADQDPAAYNSGAVTEVDPVSFELLPADSALVPRGLAKGDFDADGHTDIAVVLGSPSFSVASGKLVVFRGDGSGGFGVEDQDAEGNTIQTYNLSVDLLGNPTELVTGDFNADGRLDAVVLLNHNFDTAKRGIQVVTGTVDDGAWSMAARATIYPAGDGADMPDLNFHLLEGMAVADFNADGVLDIAVGDVETDRPSDPGTHTGIRILLGQGDLGSDPSEVCDSGDQDGS